MLELGTEVKVNLWRTCLETSTESNSLKTWLNKHQWPRKMQQGQRNIHVCTGLILLDKENLYYVLSLHSACISVHICYCLLPQFLIVYFSLRVLKMSHMVKLQKCAFILELGMAKNSKHRSVLILCSPMFRPLVTTTQTLQPHKGITQKGSNHLD